jgi:ubiquinone/menaquinone biosynthesis C-methylase UbiE
MSAELPPDFTQATAITMQTYQQIAASYAERHSPSNLPRLWQEYQERFIALVQSNANWLTNPALPILDAGCGPGRDSLFFAQQGFAVQAIDLSEAMLDQARQRCSQQVGGERILFRQMDMRQLDLPDASCAGAWVSASFLHIPKQENLIVLNELVRVLVRGGALTLLVKEADDEADERYDPAPENGLPRFFARYRGGELWKIMEQAGLRVLLLESRNDESGRGWLGALAYKRA